VAAATGKEAGHRHVSEDHGRRVREASLGGLTTGELLAIIIPLAALELGLLIWAVVDLIKRDAVKGGSKALWVIILIFFNLLGPILYLTWGRNA
jgi:hypothetical protein